MKTYYMHTINDRVASYNPGEQICFAGGRSRVVLVTSLHQIRREQQASIRWCRKNGIYDDTLRYGYALVRLP